MHTFPKPLAQITAMILGLAVTALPYPAIAAEPAAAPATTPDSADNAVESLEYSSAQGGTVIVKIGMRTAIKSAPAGFIVNNPPRIALDFAGTANKLGKNSIAADEGALRGINVVQAGNRTRMVLNLSQPVTYDTKIDGKNLLVTLQSAEGIKTTSNVTSRFAESAPVAQGHSIRDINFRRGPNNEGKIVTDLSDTSVGIDIRKQGQNLVVDIGDASLPSNLQRKLDVTDFGTPVQFVDAQRLGRNSRLIISPKGNWEYSAYQTEKQFIVEIKAAVEDANQPFSKNKGFIGEKLSLNFQDVAIRNVLAVIADFTGLNIVTSESVNGNLTLRLKDVPWDQALSIILQSKGLDMRRSGNVIWIAPRDELATKEKLELEARQQITDLEPVQTEAFHLKYHKAEAFKSILTDSSQKILSKRGSAVIDPRTNTLFIQDTPSKLEEIRGLVAQVDIPVKQVLIDARIVEASDNFAKSLGAKLGFYNAGSSVRNLQTNISGSTDATMWSTGQAETQATIPQTYSVNLPATNPLGTGNVGSIAFTIFRAGSSRFLNLELSAVEADGKGKIISNPRIVTANQVEATIQQGTQIPYQQATSSGATSVAFKNAVLSLKVKPQITPDDNIIMDLNVNKDSVGSTTTAGPTIDTKSVQTQVLVENGGTVVIGGIYEQTLSNSTTKIPVLGDIPVVGNLFKNTTNSDKKSELLIFVTPKIIKDGFNIQ